MTALFFFCLLFPIQVFAYEAFGPINLRTQHPVFLQASDLTPRAAKVLPAGTLQIRQDLAYSNFFEEASNANFRVDYDMELLRTNTNILWSAGKGFQLGLEIPFMRFDEGFMDAFIEKYHHTFGFPNAGRETLPQNRFGYRFARNGVDLMNIPKQGFALSDLIFSLQHQVNAEGRRMPAVAWFVDFRIPSGKQQDGTTTDEPGLVLGLAVQKSHKRFHGHANLAFILPGENERMQPYLHDQRFAFALTGEYSLLPTWSILLQVSGGTPYGQNTGMDTWDAPPLDIVLGFRGKETEIFGKNNNLIWQFGFSEDAINKSPSVDFTTFFSLGMEFGLKKECGCKA